MNKKIAALWAYIFFSRKKYPISNIAAIEIKMKKDNFFFIFMCLIDLGKIFIKRCFLTNISIIILINKSIMGIKSYIYYEFKILIRTKTYHKNAY